MGKESIAKSISSLAGRCCVASCETPPTRRVPRTMGNPDWLYCDAHAPAGARRLSAQARTGLLLPSFALRERGVEDEAAKIAGPSVYRVRCENLFTTHLTLSLHSADRKALCGSPFQIDTQSSGPYPAVCQACRAEASRLRAVVR